MAERPVQHCGWLRVFAERLFCAKASDAVLTDVHMSGMSGVEFCAAIKADPRLQLTPVIVLTRVSDLEARVACPAPGADDFFAKPCELLRAVLGRYLPEAVAAELMQHPQDHLQCPQL